MVVQIWSLKGINRVDMTQTDWESTRDGRESRKENYLTSEARVCTGVMLKFCHSVRKIAKTLTTITLIPRPKFETNFIPKLVT